MLLTLMEAEIDGKMFIGIPCLLAESDFGNSSIEFIDICQ